MWKSGEPPSWNPDVPRFANIGMIEGEGPGSGFWPFWLSAVMLICCIWTGVNWYKRKTPPSQSEEPFLDSYGKRILLLVGIGLLGFLIVHIIGSRRHFVFMFYYMRFLGRHSWGLTLLSALALWSLVSFSLISQCGLFCLRVFRTFVHSAL